MQVGAAASPGGGDALREHADDRVEDLPAEVPVGIGAPHETEQFVETVAPLGRCARLGDELLREDVDRGVRNADPVEVSGLHGGHKRRALDEFVAGGGEKAPLRGRVEPVA